MVYIKKKIELTVANAHAVLVTPWFLSGEFSFKNTSSE